MSLFHCSRHGLGLHAEAWHSFAYRRWWVLFHRESVRHFGGGGPSAPPAPPPPPARSDAEIQEERAKAGAQARKRRGRASTILAGETSQLTPADDGTLKTTLG